MEAELEAARTARPYQRRHPFEVLADTVMASDVLLTHLLRRRAAGELTSEESTALGWAIDRAARVSKTAIDADIAERLLELKERPTRLLIDQLVLVLRSVLADPRVMVETGTENLIILEALRKLDAEGALDDASPSATPELRALPSKADWSSPGDDAA